MVKWIKNHSLGIIITILFFLFSLFIFISVKPDIVTNKLGIEIDFLTSFRASLLEDLIFFSLIGFVLYFVTFRTIEDEEVERRIESLISAKNVTIDAKNNFKDNFKSSLTYYQIFRVEIVITEIDSSGKFVKIQANFNGYIYNLSKDLNVNTLVRAYAFSDKKINNSRGEILLLEILDAKGRELVDGANTVCQVEEEGFAKYMNVPVDLNTFVKFRFKFWIWNTITTDGESDDNGFKISSDRFVDRLDITVKTTLDNNFQVSLHKKFANEIGEDEKWKVERKKQSLSKNKDKKFIIENFKKGDLISLNITKKDNE